MPRIGTGPFPAPHSGFSVPGQYGFVAREASFGTAAFSGSYRAPAAAQYGVTVPSGYYEPAGASSQGDLGQDDPARHQAAQDDPGRPAQWPLQSRLELGALPGAVPCARLHARLVLTEWGQAGVGDSVELIVSELMTNALRACTDVVAGRPGYDAEGRLYPLGLRLRSDRRQVLVEVWDGNHAPPVPGQINLDGETGRGLMMVEAVSSRWGYYYAARQPHGTAPDPRAVKVVWALILPAA